MTQPSKCKVSIDADRCVGHGRCYDVAPNLFEPIDDEGRARALVPLVSGKDFELAKLAASSCPEGAVLLHDAD